MEVSLRPITRENFDECVGLRIADDQTGLVASNVYSIAESAIDPSLVPRAIYAGETMVGFAMYDCQPDPRDGRYWIHRLMVDTHYQGKGFGRAGLLAVMQVMLAQPGCDEIMIGHYPHNIAAKTLYESVGFVELGPAPWGGEVIARYQPG
ncbi:MAG TPA: GNAT family N-acetyltransferase [Thermomicrobiaceae bacterium]|nr:GNAT family N-acetyltransferase [Thermomicrobiaceae bacterium]